MAADAGRIGLVLGAGGAVGHAYHTGTLAALAEATGWDPRAAAIVVGTSAGSVVGALLRAGLAPADLYARSTGGPLSPEAMRLLGPSAAPSPPPRPTRPPTLRRLQPSSRALLRLVREPWSVTPSSLAAAVLPAGDVPGDAMGARIRSLYDRPWPEDPFWACVVRQGDGARVVLGRDPAPVTDVGTAVQASSAIPSWFKPVEIDGERYVDGGAWSPTNADLLAGQGLDLVVVVSPMSSSRSATARLSADAPVRAVYRARLAREVAGVRRRGTPVVTFQPSAEDLAVMGGAARAMDYERHGPVARRSRETALRRLADRRILEVLEALLGPGPPGFTAR